MKLKELKEKKSKPIWAIPENPINNFNLFWNKEPITPNKEVPIAIINNNVFKK